MRAADAALGVGAVGRPLERQRRPLRAVAHARFVHRSFGEAVQRLARGELAEADPPRELRRVGAVGVRQLDAEVALPFRVRPKMRRRVADVADAGGDPPRRLERARLLHRRERSVKHTRAAARGATQQSSAQSKSPEMGHGKRTSSRTASVAMESRCPKFCAWPNNAPRKYGRRHRPGAAPRQLRLLRHHQRRHPTRRHHRQHRSGGSARAGLRPRRSVQLRL